MMRINFENWTYNSPSSLESLNKLEDLTGLKLPPQYCEFMLKSDGGNGWIDERYYVIYSLREIYDLIKLYKEINYYTEVIVFGGDGASEMFCFDKKTTPNKILLLNTSGTLEDAINVGYDLDDVWASDIQELLKGNI